MQVVLEIVSAGVRRKTWLQGSAKLTVGRTEDADFVVPADWLLSGRHFALESGPDGCRLRDLGSTNGTYVNDRRVTECTLEDGYRIRAGETQFVVHIAASPAEPLRSTDRLAGSPPAAAPKPVARGHQPPYPEGVRDADPGVRRAALLAAAWTGQKWLLSHCRSAAERLDVQDFDAIWLLAVLGSPVELDRILAAGKASALSPRRFEVLAACGHPRVVELLFEGMQSDDPSISSAAGAAFTRITGEAIESGERHALEPAGGTPSDEFEREFLEEVALPDVARAREHWQAHQKRYSQGTRWCAGFDLSQPAGPEVLVKLPLPARYEAWLRAHYWGTSTGSPVELEALSESG
ncbi:MAG: FHA domain-containing protein [Pirellulales bacterium]